MDKPLRSVAQGEKKRIHLLKVTQRGSSADLTPRRILKLIRQGAAPVRGRSLMSTIAWLRLSILEIEKLAIFTLRVGTRN